MSTAAREVRPPGSPISPVSVLPGRRSAARRSLTVAVWTLVSRATGLLRLVVIGAVLGPTFVANTFVATNNVPGLTFSAVAGSVLGLVVVPGIVRTLLAGTPATGVLFVRRLSGLLLAVSGSFALALALLSPVLAWTLTLGVPAGERGRARLIAVVLLLMVAPQVVLYTLGALGAAAQQARQRYALAAAAPAMENIGLIVTLALVALLYRHGGDVETVPMGLVVLLGLGATVSVALHAGLQVFGASRVGLSVRPAHGWRADPEVRAVGSRLRRSVLVAALPAASLYLLLAFAATVRGGVLVFQTAYLIYLVPTALGARAVATAVLPDMSAAAMAGERSRYAQSWRQAVLYTVVVGVPALCVLVFLARPVADLLAAGRLHNASLVDSLALCVAILGISQLAYGVHEAGQQALFARLEDRGPRLAVGIAAVVIGLGGAGAVLLLDGLSRLAGLAVAMLISDVAAAVTVVALVRRRIRPDPAADLGGLARVTAAALAMVPFLWLGGRLAARGGTVHGLTVAALAAVPAVLVFLGSLVTLGVPRRLGVGVGGPGWSRRRGPPGTVVSRSLDIVAACLALLALAPILLAAAAWIRLDSPGPVLFRQQRVGRAGHHFVLLKFRSMRLGGNDRAHRELIAAELRGENTLRDGTTKARDDGRITRSGRFLRRTSIDELPQLINVLRGDMSLVGPRPCLPWEAHMFPAEFADRFAVRPGMTGLWQVSGRTTLGTLEMLRLDVAYVQDRRLSRDLRILLRTIPTLVRGDGAR